MFISRFQWPNLGYNAYETQIIEEDVMPLGNLGQGIKDALVGTIKGAGDVVGTTLDTTRQSTVTRTEACILHVATHAGSNPQIREALRDGPGIHAWWNRTYAHGAGGTGLAR